MLFQKPKFKHDYPELIRQYEVLPTIERKEAYRDMCLTDMYFLLRYGCEIPAHVVDHPFCVDRCRIADERIHSESGLDKWMIMVFREGFKSLIFNYGVNIRNILEDPESTTCIFSYKFGRAVDHLKSIKATFESSDALKSWFDDIIWQSPPREGWSADKGLVLKRKGNPKEPTIQAGGIVDGQPIGMHYTYLCFDDVVTKDSVKSPHMIEETTQGFELADNLGKSMGQKCWKWILGTHYKYGDTYTGLEAKGKYKVEKVGCRNDDGTPRAHTEDELVDKEATQGRYVFNCQMNLNPVPDADRTFDLEKVEYYDKRPNINTLRLVLFCDPAHTEKSKRNHDPDFTSMWVVGYDRTGWQWWVDGIYDRIKATEATRKAFELARKYNIKWVSWEQVAAQSDTQFIQHLQSDTGLSFKIEPFRPNGYGSKQDRIEGALLARVESGRIKFPRKAPYKQADGHTVDLMEVMRQEMLEFPHASGTAGSHDDFLDCGSHFLHTPKYGSTPNVVRSDSKWAGYSDILKPGCAKKKITRPISVVNGYI